MNLYSSSTNSIIKYYQSIMKANNDINTQIISPMKAIIRDMIAEMTSVKMINDEETVDPLDIFIKHKMIILATISSQTDSML